MGKTLFIAEKPSVAMDFVKLLKVNGRRNNGYIE
ncbi:topoisomerase I, partial [Clostridium saudiense]|nr:topoisomerase I [Clostridium saudiense]